MKHPDKTYDVIVLCTGFSGLIAANRLTKENRSVLLLKEKKYHSSYSRGGYRFVPFSNFSEKRIPAWLLKRISRAADHWEKPRKGSQPEQDIAFQVVLPEARTDLYRDPSLLQREWRREFPRELKQIESFYSELRRIKEVLKEIKSKAGTEAHFPIYEGPFLKRWLNLDRLPGGGTDQWFSSFSPEFKKLIELQMISYGYLCSDSYPLALVSHLLVHGDGETREERVDPERVELGMIETFTQSGGSLKEIEGIEEVEVKRRGEFSLSLKGEDKTFRSRTLLLGSPFHRLSNLFSKRGKPLLAWGGKIRPRYILVPFCLGIDERVIPVGMRDLLVSMLNLQKPYDGGNLLFLRLSRKGDERQAPKGKRALTVQCFMPFQEYGKNSICDLQGEVLNHLKHLFPFLENHMEFIDRNWAEEQMDCWSYPHYFYEVDSGFNWRRGIIPIRISKNLYFSGRENFPYLGLEGEMLSGALAGKKISGRTYQ